MIKALFILTFPIFGFAMDPNALLELIVIDHSRIQCHENYDDAQKFARECAEIVCGPANKIPPSVLEPEHFDQYDFSSAKERFSKIEKALVKIIEKEHKNGTEVLEQLKQKIKNGITLSSEEASQYIAQATVNDLLIEQDIDTNKLSVSMRGFEKRTDKKKEMITKYLKFLEENLPSSNELKRQYGLFLSIDEKKELLEAKMYEIDNVLISVLEINGHESGLLNSIKNGISFYKRGGAIPSYALDFLIKDSEQLQQVLANQYKAKFKKTKISFCDEKCLEYFKTDEFKKDILASIDNQLEINKTNLVSPEEIAKGCKGAFYLDAYNQAIQKKMNLGDVMGDINYASESFTRYLGKEFSGETEKLVSEKFSQLRSVIISGKPIVGGNFSLASYQIENFQETYKSKTLEGVSDFELFSIGMNGAPSYNFLMSKCSGVSKGLVTMNDFYNTYYDQINISSFSCEHEVSGGQVIVHELGHMLSNMVKSGSISMESRKKFLEKRECVSNRHIYKNYSGSNSLKHYGDHLYSEEDFADYLSDMTFSSSKKIGNSEHLQYCSQLPVSGGEYRELKTQFHQGNPHSPVIYRVINSLINKGVEVPESCQNFLESQLMPYAPNKCE